MLEIENIPQEIRALYDPTRYQDKSIIILGVHSHDHDSVRNPTDREYYCLSRYMQENPNVVVCSASHPDDFKTYGYLGYGYVEQHFRPFEFIGRAVWYRGDERLTGVEAVQQLHSIIETRFGGQQVILLQPGTPYVGDAITENLLREPGAEQKYLVIDDPQAGIYQLMDEAAEALYMPQETDRSYVIGSVVAETDDVHGLLKTDVLSCILALQKMYDRDNGSLPLLLRVLERLIETYDGSLPIYVTEPNQERNLTTLAEFRGLVLQDIEGHTDRHYSLVICPSETDQRKKQIANTN